MPYRRLTNECNPKRQVRKAKVVVRHFPHEVSDLDPVLTLLEAEGDNTENWETRYVLLLWMSMLVLIPFDMKRFDSGEKKDTVTDRILAVIQSNLRWSNKSQASQELRVGKFVKSRGARGDLIRIAD